MSFANGLDAGRRSDRRPLWSWASPSAGPQSKTPPT